MVSPSTTRPTVARLLAAVAASALPAVAATVAKGAATAAAATTTSAAFCILLTGLLLPSLGGHTAAAEPVGCVRLPGSSRWSGRACAALRVRLPVSHAP